MGVNFGPSMGDSLAVPVATLAKRPTCRRAGALNRCRRQAHARHKRRALARSATIVCLSQVAFTPNELTEWASARRLSGELAEGRRMRGISRPETHSAERELAAEWSRLSNGKFAAV